MYVTRAGAFPLDRAERGVASCCPCPIEGTTLRRAARWILLCLLVATSAEAERGPVERLTLVVEVTSRERRPVLACGRVGAQAREVVARVISVEKGRFDAGEIRLAWPMCEFSRVEPGMRFRIRARPRAAPSHDARSPATYVVTGEDALR